MSEFITALSTNPFLLYSLGICILSSLACGIIGTYVVTRRITFIAGGLAHCVLGGMGAANYLNRMHGWEYAHPMLGAIIAALVAAAIIGWVSLKAREREDTIISALWAIGMAAGVLFLHFTDGYSQDLIQFLFGNVMLVSKSSLWIAVGLDIVILGTCLLFFNQFQALCFDEEFARLRGINVEWLYFLLLGLTALTVVLLSSLVGVVMVIALLTLPVALAGLFTKTLFHMMLGATIVCALFTTGGLVVSFNQDLPPGATIITLTGVAYLVALFLKSVIKAPAKKMLE